MPLPDHAVAPVQGDTVAREHADLVETGDRRLAQNPTTKEAAELVHAGCDDAIDGDAGIYVREPASVGAEVVAGERCEVCADAADGAAASERSNKGVVDRRNLAAIGGMRSVSLRVVIVFDVGLEILGAFPRNVHGDRRPLLITIAEHPRARLESMAKLDVDRVALFRQHLVCRALGKGEVDGAKSDEDGEKKSNPVHRAL
jgi:hypothetical protein